MAKEKKAEGASEVASYVKKIGPGTPVEQALETAPVIYLDGAVGFGTARGMVEINLYQDRLSIRPEQLEHQEQGVTRVICARLIMPQTVAYELRDWLVKALENLEKTPGKSPAK